jgi:type II secretory pathway component PulF
VKDLATFYRGLASLHRAGISWSEALKTTAEDDPALAPARAQVAAGKPLSEALGSLLPGLDVALIRAGETSGRLEQAFEALSQRHDDERRRRGQRRVALAYPLLLAHVGALLLPLPDLMRGRPGQAVLWLLLPLLPIYALLLLSRWKPKGDGPLPHRFPWTNRVEEEDARALDALGSLYDAGVPILEALPLARRAGPRGRAASDLARAEGRVKDGLDLAGAWHALPRTVTAGLATAEKAGSLGAECRAAAERLAFDVEIRRKKLTARLGPVLVLVLGGIIGARVLLFWASAYRAAGL